MCCDDNYIIALADDILTTWNNNLSIPVQAGKQKVILQFQIHDWFSNDRRILLNLEFQCLCPVIKDMIQCLDIASDRILHRTDIRQNLLCCDITWIYDTSDVQTIKYIAECAPVDLRDYLRVGAFSRK